MPISSYDQQLEKNENPRFKKNKNLDFDLIELRYWCG